MKKLWLLHFSSHIRDFKASLKLYCDASIFQWGLHNDFSCSVHTLCALYGSKSLQPVFICYHQIFIILIHIPHTLYSLISTDFIFTDWWSTTWTCGGWNTVLSNISPSPLHFCQPLNEPCSSLSLLFGAKRKNCCSVVWKDNISESTQTSSHLSSDTSWTFRN